MEIGNGMQTTFNTEGKIMEYDKTDYDVVLDNLINSLKIPNVQAEDIVRIAFNRGREAGRGEAVVVLMAGLKKDAQRI